MSYLFGFFLILLLISSAAAIMLTVPPARIANGLRSAGPVAMMAAGAGLTLAGRGAIGLPLVLLGFTFWRRNRGVRMAMGSRGGQKSTVRSAMFEMELDHETGDIDGTVLIGEYEGMRLSALSEEQILALHATTGRDGESAALLEAYLDRRISGWREDTQANSNSGHGSATGSGPMTKEEAYQILGLSPGAGTDEIREAHRRLMKRIHPDSGGSTFLASKINEAKEVLLG